MNTFRANLNTLAIPFGLTGAQIVNRATANSCAGCHLPGAFGLRDDDSIAPGKKWPNALDFVHVDTPPAVSIAGHAEFDATKFDNTSQGFNISPALLDDFLPGRRVNLVGLGTMPVCDCVPKVDLISTIRATLPRQRQLIEFSTARIQAELAEVDKRFLARRSVTADDSRRHFDAKRAILASREAERNKVLESEGIPTSAPALKPQAIKLSATRATPERLRALKAAKLREIVNAEPPRETINGSFRTH